MQKRGIKRKKKRESVHRETEVTERQKRDRQTVTEKKPSVLRINLLNRESYTTHPSYLLKKR